MRAKGQGMPRDPASGAMFGTAVAAGIEVASSGVCAFSFENRRTWSPAILLLPLAEKNASPSRTQRQDEANEIDFDLDA